MKDILIPFAAAMLLLELLIAASFFFGCLLAGAIEKLWREHRKKKDR